MLRKSLVKGLAIVLTASTLAPAAITCYANQTPASVAETSQNNSSSDAPDYGPVVFPEARNTQIPKVAFNLKSYPEKATPGILPRIIACCYKIDRKISMYQLKPGDIVYAFNEKGNRGDIIRITKREELDQMWGLYSYTEIGYKSITDRNEDTFSTEHYDKISYYTLKRLDNINDPALIDNVKLTANLLDKRSIESFNIGSGKDTVYDYSNFKEFLRYAKGLRNRVKTGWVYDLDLKH